MIGTRSGKEETPHVSFIPPQLGAALTNLGGANFTLQWKIGPKKKEKP